MKYQCIVDIGCNGYLDVGYVDDFSPDAVFVNKVVLLSSTVQQQHHQEIQGSGLGRGLWARHYWTRCRAGLRRSVLSG
jgi:hypothetical protein